MVQWKTATIFVATLAALAPLAGATNLSAEGADAPSEDEIEAENRLASAGADADGALEPVASGGAYEVPADCPVQQDPRAVSILDRYYLKESLEGRTSTTQLWSETNSLPGLQTSETFCGYDDPPIPADTRVTTLSTGSIGW